MLTIDVYIYKDNDVYTPVEQKRHEKHENDHWRLLFYLAKLLDAAILILGATLQTEAKHFEEVRIPANMIATKIRF